MAQIHPGPPWKQRQAGVHHTRSERYTGSSIADRRTDIAEAGGAEPPRRTTFPQRSRSSMYRAPRFERGGCRRNSCREYHFQTHHISHFSRCSPMQRQRAQTSSSAGASPAAGTNFHPAIIFAPVAQCRGRGLKPREVSVQVRPGAHNLQSSPRPCSPTAETAASKAVQCECESRRGHLFLFYGT